MARVYGIQKQLEQNNIDEKLIKEIIGNGHLVDIITRMEKSLDPDMMIQILDPCACGGGKEYGELCKNIGKEIAGEPSNERIDHMNNIAPGSDKIALNVDNTLTAQWPNNEKGKYKRVCSAVSKKA